MTKKETERNVVRKDEQGEREGTDIVGEKIVRTKSLAQVGVSVLI